METNFKWFSKRIRDLHSEDNVVYGVGDEGIFIRSMNGGENWTIQRFPTKATSWNVCSDVQGNVVAHGEKRCIFLIISVRHGKLFIRFLSMAVRHRLFDRYFYINITYLLVRKYMLNMVVFGSLI